VGIGLSVRNALAVLEAIVGKKSEFVRTPKYRVEAGSKQSGAWIKKAYHKRAGYMPYFEVLLGIYFACTIVYAVQNENYATVPFLLLFVWGYLYTGLMSLGQTYISGLRFGSAAAPATAPVDVPVNASAAPAAAEAGPTGLAGF